MSLPEPTAPWCFMTMVTTDGQFGFSDFKSEKLEKRHYLAKMGVLQIDSEHVDGGIDVISVKVDEVFQVALQFHSKPIIFDKNERTVSWVAHMRNPKKGPFPTSIEKFFSSKMLFFSDKHPIKVFLEDFPFDEKTIPKTELTESVLREHNKRLPRLEPILIPTYFSRIELLEETKSEKSRECDGTSSSCYGGSESSYSYVRKPDTSSDGGTAVQFSPMVPDPDGGGRVLPDPLPPGYQYLCDADLPPDFDKPRCHPF